MTRGATLKFDKDLNHELNILTSSMQDNTLTDEAITIRELIQAIRDLKCGKGCRPDNVSNEILKHSSPVMIDSLSKLFNSVLKSGFYPEMWNKSHVVPIFKNGNRNLPENYRGISLINCMGKLFNSILNTRLVKFMENKLCHLQFGFR